ncbi:hypothetical protein JCM10213_003817 [Rhodosporidiobolus nylandii]
MRVLPTAPEALLLALVVGHTLVVPGTKVEESFTLHAVRDVLLKGYKGEGALAMWDHVEFPGAVTRSFVPPLALAALCRPVLEAASRLGVLGSGLDAQVAVRLTLGVFSAFSLIFFSRRVATAYGAKVAKYFLLLLATSFHVPFWAGRTVPNMLAFPLVQVALAFFVTPPVLTGNTAKPRGATKRTLKLAFAFLTVAAVVIRLELVALIVPFVLEHLIRGTLSIVDLVEVGVVAGGASLALTASVDTAFWGGKEWLWPEGQAAWFNVVQGKSAEWGVSPFYFYLFPTLPRLLHLALPFAFFSLAADRRTRRLLWPCICFIALMSGLKHKEWRFIVYVVPAFFAAAAAGIVGLGAITASPRFRRLSLLVLISVNLLFTLLGLAASSANYPGLSAVRALEAHVASLPPYAEPVKVWVGVEAKMKGASNFVLFDSPVSSRSGEAWYLSPTSAAAVTSAPRIEYNKAEDAAFISPSSPSSLLPALADAGFDYAVVDGSARTDGADVVYQASEFGWIDWGGLASGKVRRWEGLVEAKRRGSVMVVRVAHERL